MILGGRKAVTPDLLEARATLCLLGEQHRLDAVEETFQPPDELSMRDAELRVTWRFGFERKAEPRELVA